MVERQRPVTVTKLGGLVRLDLFTDAVFAIAITLLVIELKLPEHVSPEHLGDALLEMHPRFLAYLVSFLIVGLQWFDHHSMFEHITRYNSKLLWSNLLFLLWIAFIPFPTSLIGEMPQSKVAVTVYGLTIVGVCISKAWLWHYATAGGRLITDGLSKKIIKARSTLNLLAVLISSMLVIFGLFFPRITLLFWVFFGIGAILIRILRARMTSE